MGRYRQRNVYDRRQAKYGLADILAHSHVGLDPSRIAAQVVSGMGFLDAGTIIIQKQAVKGLTTAVGERYQQRQKFDTVRFLEIR